jgi:hypothetical protein
MNAQRPAASITVVERVRHLPAALLLLPGYLITRIR